jgi:hypothetical protein
MSTLEEEIEVFKTTFGIDTPTVSKEKRRDVLADMYYDPKQGFLSEGKFYHKVAKLGYTKKEVREFLREQEVFQLHKRKVKRVYYPITAGGEGSYQADLTFYDAYKKKNNNYSGILVWINIHTRKAYAEAVKGKRVVKDKNQEVVDVLVDEDSIVGASKRILKRIKEKVNNLTTDSGGEFVNHKFHALMEKEGISITHVEKDNKNKMGKVERFNRTLRGMIEKYITAHNTTRWVDVLQDLIDNYNGSYHRTLKTTPNEADGGKVEGEEAARVMEVDDVATKYQVGDRVRLLKIKTTFGKTGETYYKGVYTVTRVNPESYNVMNDNGDELKRTVQWYELQGVGKVRTAPKKKDGKDERVLVVKDAHTDRRVRKEGVVRHPKPSAPRETREGRAERKVKRRAKRGINTSNIVEGRRGR